MTNLYLESLLDKFISNRILLNLTAIIPFAAIIFSFTWYVEYQMKESDAFQVVKSYIQSNPEPIGHIGDIVSLNLTRKNRIRLSGEKGFAKFHTEIIAKNGELILYTELNKDKNTPWEITKVEIK